MEALSSTDTLLFEGFRLDWRGLFRRDESAGLAPVEIGSRAIDVLRVLLERPGDLLSRDEIMAAAWPGTVVEDNNLNVQISTLRRVLDQDRTQGGCIQTVPRRGYRFTAAVTRVEPDARRAPRRSIVVLPFTNLSEDREQQYFADGITEDLTTDLSRIAYSFVISRNTAFTYRTKLVNTKQIGRELGVRYVLEGSVRRSGNQVRVTAQLIDAETDTHLWAERFDLDMADLFVLQNEITGRIANTLNIELVAAEAARPTDNPDALDYIFRGRAVTLKPLSRSVYAKAISMYERALALDPRSAEAQSLLAEALAHRVLVGVTDSTADIARAEELIDRALAASPRYPLAHFAKGQLLRALGRTEEAIPEYETVLAINRNAAGVLHVLADCKLLTGSIEEVIPLEEQAIRLSPRDPRIGHFYWRIGHVHLLQSRPDEAILWLERARSVVPELPFLHLLLASAYGLQGETERAAAALAEARRLHGGDRYSNIAHQKAFYSRMAGAAKIRPLLEATYLAGLRKAGMPEE
jgi:TolB-like protein/Flp pilus assembly protein TadD